MPSFPMMAVMCTVSGSVAWMGIEKRRNTKRNNVSIGGKSETLTLVGLYTGQGPQTHKEIWIMKLSQHASGGLFGSSWNPLLIACLLSAPCCTSKWLASPNNQTAPYASTQHHLWLPRSQKMVGDWWFSQVGIKLSCHGKSCHIFDLEDVQTCIWWAEGQTSKVVPAACQRLESQRPYQTVGYFMSVVSQQ